MKAASGRPTPTAALCMALIAFCSLATAPVQEPAGPATPEQEVRALAERWKTALEGLDARGAIALYAQDFLLGGTTRTGHWRAYWGQLERMRRMHVRLTVEPLVQKVELWRFEGSRTVEFADIELVVHYKQQWDSQRRARRFACPVRLRREGAQWKACGDQLRTACTLQVGYDGQHYMLTLTAASAWPSFPNKARLKGAGLEAISLRRKGRDAYGRPYVTETAYLPTRPAIGAAYMFQIPYKNGNENVPCAVRGTVDVIPAITEPRAEAPVTQWPLGVSWQDVSARVKDFSNYEVHVRRPGDNAALWVMRSIPADQTQVTIGETRQEQAALAGYGSIRLEVYALDIYGNYGVARRGVRLPAAAGAD